MSLLLERSLSTLREGNQLGLEQLLEATRAPKANRSGLNQEMLLSKIARCTGPTGQGGVVAPILPEPWNEEEAAWCHWNAYFVEIDDPELAAQLLSEDAYVPAAERRASSLTTRHVGPEACAAQGTQDHGKCDEE